MAKWKLRRDVAAEAHKIIAAAKQKLAGYLLLNSDFQRLEFIRALAPEKQDYAQIFVAKSAELARLAYAPIWQEPLLWPIDHDQTELKIEAATVEQILAGAPEAAAFPGGYGQVLHHYQPQQTLICAEFMTPGTSAGIAIDGLLACADFSRWIWLPKPWRVLPVVRTHLLQYWTR